MLFSANSAFDYLSVLKYGEMTQSSLKDVQDVKVRKKNTNFNAKFLMFQPLKKYFLEFCVIQLNL